MKVDQEYEKYKAMSKPDILRKISRMSGGISEVEIGRLVLEDKQMEEREEFEKELINLQYEFNKENINLQNQFNSELSDKQVNLYKSLQRIMIIATILAAIIGAIVGGFSQHIIPHLFQ